MVETFRIVRRCAIYLGIFLLLREFMPNDWNIVLVLLALVLAYIDRQRTPSSRHLFFQYRAPAICSLSLAGWQAWLVALEVSTLSVQDIPFASDILLEATSHAWRMSKVSQSRPSIVSALLTILILMQCLIPILTFILLHGIILHVIYGVLIGTMFFWHLFLWHTMRRPYAQATLFSVPTKKKITTYVLYLPQKQGPAFARRTWNGYEIYLDARMVHQLSESDLNVLQAHEQGHIARGHTDIQFYLHLLRALIVVCALIGVVFFSSILSKQTGPLAALICLAFVVSLLAPEAVKVFCRARWEREADQWAGGNVSEQALQTLRIGLQTKRYY